MTLPACITRAAAVLGLPTREIYQCEWQWMGEPERGPDLGYHDELATQRWTLGDKVRHFCDEHGPCSGWGRGEDLPYAGAWRAWLARESPAPGCTCGLGEALRRIGGGA